MRFQIDTLFAYIAYCITPNQHIGYRFYEKNGLERQRFYTYGYAMKN